MKIKYTVNNKTGYCETECPRNKDIGISSTTCKQIVTCNYKKNDK